MTKQGAEEVKILQGSYKIGLDLSVKWPSQQQTLHT